MRFALIVVGAVLSACAVASPVSPTRPAPSQSAVRTLPATPAPAPSQTASAVPSTVHVPESAQPTGSAARCQLDPATTPAPIPSGPRPENERLLNRLPFDPFDPYFPGFEPRGVVRGDWALADDFWFPAAAGLLQCTGARPRDMWMGLGRLDDSVDYMAVAFEIDGWTGEELLDIWLTDMNNVDDSVFSPAVHEGRSYLVTDVSPRYAVYAAGPTFYTLRPFCCVDRGLDGPPIPSESERIEILLEHMPTD